MMGIVQGAPSTVFLKWEREEGTLSFAHGDICFHMKSLPPHSSAFSAKLLPKLKVDLVYTKSVNGMNT
jgi:hypothetical protein